MIKKAKVLVGSPIRQKPPILHEFLESLKTLNQQTSTLDFFFVDDNEKVESHQLLQSFASCRAATIYTPENQNESYVCNETTHYWKNELIWKVAAFKDLMIEEAKSKDYDYLFLIDSDVVLHPDTVDRLISDNCEIVTNILWTNWLPDNPPLPTCWASDHYTLFEHEISERLTKEEAERRQRIFLDRLKKPGLYEVGGLCACTLIARSALLKPISFRRIRNITYWGEDRHFCIRASALGISLFVDTQNPGYHIYRDTDLPGVKEFKRAYES